MKTKLLYLEDAYLKESEAKIIDIEIVNNKLAKVILDQTIFFAEGGGQPSDQGQIIVDDVSYKVKQVRLEGGEIKHYIDLKSTAPEKGKCYMEIDWPRRYHNMQIHSAGHIIDWAISELKIHNEKIKPSKANHGKKPFIKYQGSAEEIEKSDLQKRVNKLIEKNLKINVKFVTLKELEKIALYTFPNLPTNKPLRIVQLEGYSAVPDGGTLVKKTGEVPSIVIEKVDASKDETVVFYKVETAKKEKQESANTEDVEKIDAIIKKFESEGIKAINEASTLPMVEKLRIKFLGRKSELTQVLRKLKDLPYDDRARIGQVANKLKNKLESAIDEKIELLSKKQLKKTIEKDWEDVTAPGILPKIGHVHPITQMMWKTTDIFQSMGFSIVEPTEIDNDFNHFTALNIPEGHPARDMWDTFWTEDDQIAIAHTSTMQNRILSSFEPPIRAIVPGRCFRNEATDKSHEHTFYQVEGVYLDKGITLTHLVSTLKTFLERFFEKDIRIKIQPSYFPFVEPAIEIMMERPGYTKKDKNKYDNKEWLEVIPCGPIHPNVLKAANIDPEVYSGFAWGFGLDRISMVKYGIDDIRHFHSGDLRFIKQF